MRDYKLVVNSQDYTSTEVLDLYENVNIPVIFNVKDVREPESIKTNYTKQFDIPASHINNEFFDGLYEKGFSVSDFNPNFRIDCQLMYDENIIIDGYLQVVDVNRVDEDGYYSVIIYGELSSLFNNIIGCKLSNLDLSEYNHNWTYDNVKNSWDTSIKRNNLDIPFLNGRGYVYPLIYRGQQDNDFNVEDFLPSVFIKTIWDKVFQNSGKKYKSEFLNGEIFKSLILPFTKSKLYLSDEEKNNRLFSAKITASDYNDLGYSGYKKHYTGSVTNIWTSPKYKIQFPTEEADPNGLFFTNDTYIPKVKQNTSIASNICVKTIFRAAPGQPSGFFIKGPTIKGNVYLKNETTNQFIYSEPFEVIHEKFNPVGVAGSDYVVNTSVFFDYTGLLEAGNKYSIYIDYIMSAGPYASKFVNIIGQTIGGYIFNGVSTDSNCETEIFNTTAQEYILEGDIVDMNQVLPDDITCIDFIKDINKMFNLYWVPIDEDTFQIEPRDVFYNGDNITIYDWTKKFNRDEELKIIPLSELNNKRYLFTYEEDDDWYNDLYLKEHNEIYGQKVIEIQNDFVTDDNDITLKFSPSPLIKLFETDIVAPTFSTISNGFTEPYDVNPRVLIYGGMKNTSFDLKFKDVNFNQYPYAGHFDDPYSPNYDINWGQTKEYYYDWGLVPQDNLYDTYWKNTILDIISPDSHMLIGQLHLTPLDIVKLNIFDTIQVDEVYYKINKLEYDILTEVAKVELFKTFTYLSFPAKKITSTGNSGVITNPITNPTRPWPFATGINVGWGGGYYVYNNAGYSTNGVGGTAWGTWTNQTSIGFEGWTYKKFNEDISTSKNVGNNTYSKGKIEKYDINQNTYKKGAWTEIMGKSNYIAPQSLGISIKGNENRVSDRVKNVSIMGNNNFIEAGVENTQVIGDGLYVTKSNATYINGDIIEKGTVKQAPNFIGNMINRTSAPYNSGDRIDLIKCPIDCVQNTGGVSRFNFINCGVDNTLEFLF